MVCASYLKQRVDYITRMIIITGTSFRRRLFHLNGKYGSYFFREFKLVELKLKHCVWEPIFILMQNKEIKNDNKSVTSDTLYE